MTRSGFRRFLFLAGAAGLLVAVAVAGVATADGPVRVEVGNLVVTADGGLTPKAISKTKLTPVSFNASGKIETKDHTHPPALTEVLIEGDKNVAVNTKGLDQCAAGQLQSRDTAAAKAACDGALVGTGTTTVEVQFPESKPIDVDSELLVFNGGHKGNVTTLYIHAYFSAPVTGAIVTTVKIKPIKKGRYGILSTATIPKIAGGSGSVTSFSLKIDRKYTFKGRKMSVISAKCPDGKIQAKATAKFTDGTAATAGIIRGCTGKS
jgi:hypothetical protein